MYIQNDNTSKVVIVRILIFLGGCIVALMIIVHVRTIIINEDLAVNKTNLLMGTRLSTLGRTR